MKYTKNLNLKKPDQEDFYQVDDFNENVDKIDDELNKRVKSVNNVPAGTDGNVNVLKLTRTAYLSKNVDLNDYKEVGIYGIDMNNVAATIKNMPVPLAGMLEVKHSASGGYYVTQEYTTCDENPKIFIRNWYVGTNRWGKWLEVVTNKTIATAENYGIVRVATEEDVIKGEIDAAITADVYHDVSDFRHANTTYKLGDKVECMFNFELFLECVQAGTTSEDPLDTRNVAHNQELIDGSVKWIVRTHVNREMLENNGGLAFDENLLYLNDEGTKRVSKVYFDRNKKGLFKCIQTTTSTVNSATYFKDISNNANSDRLDNLFEIKWHNGDDFNCSTASGYSFRLGKFCILMIQNHPNSYFEGLIKFPFKFNTKQELNIIVTDNDTNAGLSYAKTHVGWTSANNGLGVKISGVNGGHTITVIGILD